PLLMCFITPVCNGDVITLRSRPRRSHAYQGSMRPKRMYHPQASIVRLRAATRTAAQKPSASFCHRREDGSALGLQQHYDEPGRPRVAGIAPHDVNIAGTLVERLPRVERDGRLAFQLHDDLAFQHVDERMGIVPMGYVSCARRIRHLDHATL